MDCNRAKELLPENADGRLSGRDAAELRTHLDTCAACREEERLLKGTWDLLNAYPAIEVSDAFFARLKNKLRKVPWFIKLATPLVGAAAAVIFALVVFTHHPRPDQTGPENGRPAASDKVTDEERELVENLDLLENYDVVKTLEVVSEGKTSPHAHEVLFDENGENK